MTPYERTCSAAYKGKLVPYGEPIFAQVVPKRKGNARWLKALFLGKTRSNDQFIVASRSGVRVCRSVRRTGHAWSEDKDLYENVAGQPWDYSSGVYETRLVPPAKSRRPNALPTPDDEAASDPPSPVPLGFSGPASVMPEQSAASAATPAEMLPPTPVGPAASETPSKRAKLHLSRPPPASARVPDVPVFSPAPEVPNPALSIPLGPQTPESALDDLAPSSDVAMPSAGADSTTVEERVSKAPRIRTVSFGDRSFDLNDEGYDGDFSEWEDPETFYKLSEQWSDDECEPARKIEPDSASMNEAGQCSDEALWFKDLGREPDLSAEELYELDRIADEVEVSRLIRKAVLRPVSEQDDVRSMKSLSTKMVRTWRRKRRGNQSYYLRRSRLVAREFKWLEEKQGLFSPSTTTNVVKLIPVLFLMWRMTRPDTTYAIASIDVKDAYLEVPQEEPVIAGLPADYVGTGKYVFLRCVPGQRDGAQRWFSYYVSFLKSEMPLTACVENPAIMRVPEGPMLMHVDDGLTLGPLEWLKQKYIPTLKTKFEISVEIAYRLGDSFSFLKRKRTILESGILIETPETYIRHMASILDVKHTTKHNTPYLADLIQDDRSAALGPADAAKYRSALGVALYLSNDRIDICYSVRVLAGFMSAPTQSAWKGLVRLTKYLLNTMGYATLLAPKRSGSTVYRETPYDDQDHCMEIYSDSDWSGNKVTRKSFGCATFAINGCVVHHMCRSHRTISLSSAEAEWYAGISASCEGLFIRSVFEFMAGSPCSLHLKMDNSAARQLALRQGVGNKTRHIAGRLLWLQQAVREGQLTVSAIASAYNLGDLSTKMHSAIRLKVLMFLHGCADAVTAQTIGSEEFEEMVMRENVKSQVKRVRQGWARELGSSECFTGDMNRLAKRVAMLTIMMMPTLAEAADDGTQQAPNYSLYFVTVLCMLFAVYRALSHFQDGYGPLSGDAATFVYLGGSMLSEMSGEQWMIMAMLAALWNENFRQRAVVTQTSRVPEQVQTSSSFSSASHVQMTTSVTEPAATTSATDVVDIPQAVYCSERGECFHAYGCHVLRNVRSKVKKYKPCVYCMRSRNG